MEWFRSRDFSTLASSKAKGKRNEREENEISMNAKKNHLVGGGTKKTFPKQKIQQLLTHK